MLEQGSRDGFRFLRVTGLRASAVRVEELGTIFRIVDVEPGTGVGIPDELCLGDATGHCHTCRLTVLIYCDYRGVYLVLRSSILTMNAV